jgi:hypothetical protein
VAREAQQVAGKGLENHPWQQKPQSIVFASASDDHSLETFSGLERSPPCRTRSRVHLASLPPFLAMTVAISDPAASQRNPGPVRIF